MPNSVTSASRFVLYHTDGCHLCELALAIVQQAQVEFDYVDICDCAELAARYGTSIPVFVNGQHELCWPFDASQLTQFLGE